MLARVITVCVSPADIAERVIFPVYVEMALVVNAAAVVMSVTTVPDATDAGGLAGPVTLIIIWRGLFEVVITVPAIAPGALMVSPTTKDAATSLTVIVCGEVPETVLASITMVPVVALVIVVPAAKEAVAPPVHAALKVVAVIDDKVMVPLGGVAPEKVRVCPEAA